MGDNILEGKQFYLKSDQESRDWFARQWAAWPVRVDKKCTTNLGFLYGGILAYRELHSCDPIISKSLQSHVKWHDTHQHDNSSNRLID